MTEKKKFVEPQVVKYQESLDKVTLSPNNGYLTPDNAFKPIKNNGKGNAHGHDK